MEEQISHLEGVEGIDIGAGEDGFKLYLERKDGSGVAVPIDGDTYESLQHTFMEFEESAQDCETCKYAFTSNPEKNCCGSSSNDSVKTEGCSSNISTSKDTDEDLDSV